MQDIPYQPGTGQIACLIASPPPRYFVFKIENVKVKVKLIYLLQSKLLKLGIKISGKNENFGNFA